MNHRILTTVMAIVTIAITVSCRKEKEEVVEVHNLADFTVGLNISNRLLGYVTPVVEYCPSFGFPMDTLTDEDFVLNEDKRVGFSFNGIGDTALCYTFERKYHFDSFPVHTGIIVHYLRKNETQPVSNALFCHGLLYRLRINNFDIEERDPFSPKKINDIDGYLDDLLNNPDTLILSISASGQYELVKDVN